MNSRLQRKTQPISQPERPLKVGIDVRLAHWPGIGRYIEESVLHMALQFRDTEFVLFRSAKGPSTRNRYEDPALPSRLRESGARNVRFVACDTKPFSLNDAWRFGRLVQREEVQVLHSPYINLPLLPKSLPVVVTLHDFQHPDLAMRWLSPRTWAKRGYYELLTRYALHRAKAVVCVSHFLADQLRDFKPSLAPRLHVIPHAASHSFSPMPARQAAEAVAAAFNLRGRYALFVGTLKPHKNLLALVNAMALPGLPEDFQLAVAAERDGRYPEVERTVRKLGLGHRVRFLGHVSKSQLPALYGAARVTVLPSEYESFGLPVVESMACGTPVIAAPLASLPEIGDTAAWYAEPTAQALNAALQEAVWDDAQHARRRELGLAHAATFSWQRSAASLHQLYESLRDRSTEPQLVVTPRNIGSAPESDRAKKKSQKSPKRSEEAFASSSQFNLEP